MAAHSLPCKDETTHVGFFDNSLAPILTIDSGDTVVFEIGTLMANRVEEGMTIDDLRRLRDSLNIPTGMAVHTMTGPVAVRGAKVGQVLEARVNGLELGPFGYNVTYPGSMCRGFLPEDFPNGHLKWFHYPPSKDRVEFAPGITIPLKPFLGIMGVAPLEPGLVSSGPPNSFGGNMDNKELVAGTTIYFPIWNDGALFSPGDAHAVQGNGEVTVTAIETSFRSASLTFRVRDDMRLERPMAETPTHWITMGFDPDLDVAAKTALRDMIAFLCTRWKLSREDAYSLSSLAVDLEITQVVDGNRGVHAMLAKGLFYD
ncbi:MAG: acetamidase/formamidase family protein [Chloroflexota bacterium]